MENKLILEGTYNITKSKKKKVTLKEVLKDKIDLVESVTLMAELFICFLKFNNIRIIHYREISNTDFNRIRYAVIKGRFPPFLIELIRSKYIKLLQGGIYSVLVYAQIDNDKDLHYGSFEPRQYLFKVVYSFESLLSVIKEFISDMFTIERINYCIVNNVSPAEIITPLVLARKSSHATECAGFATGMEIESGFRSVIQISGIWGEVLGIMEGVVQPDEFTISRPFNAHSTGLVLQKSLGSKTLQYNVEVSGYYPTPEEKKNNFVLTDQESLLLAEALRIVELYYDTTVQLQWYKDAITSKLYIIRISNFGIGLIKTVKEKKQFIDKSTLLRGTGLAVGGGIVSGQIRKITSKFDFDKVNNGDIGLFETADMEWLKVLDRLRGVICLRGSRHSIFADFARRLKIPMVTNASDSVRGLLNGDLVTLNLEDGMLGKIYNYKIQGEQDALINPAMFNDLDVAMELFVDRSEESFSLSLQFPNIMSVVIRLGKIIEKIGIHPLAPDEASCSLNDVEQKFIDDSIKGYPDRKTYFIERIRQEINTIAHAFYPAPVVVMLSGLSTDDYKELFCGNDCQSNHPDLAGLRGVDRYLNPSYRKAFLLELEALKIAKQNMGSQPLDIIFPFCKKTQDVKALTLELEKFGFIRGLNNFKLYLLTNLPVNFVDADAFIPYVDGFYLDESVLDEFSLGANDHHPSLLNEVFCSNIDSFEIGFLETLSKVMMSNQFKISIFKNRQNGSRLLNSRSIFTSLILEPMEIFNIRNSLSPKDWDHFYKKTIIKKYTRSRERVKATKDS